MAWLFKKTLLKGETPMLIMELPPYKRPLLRVVVRHMWDRSKIFLRRAGTVILGINILLWFLATYPKTGSNSETRESRTDRSTATFPMTRQTGQIHGEIARTMREIKLTANQKFAANSTTKKPAKAAQKFCRPAGTRHRTGHRAARFRLEDGHWHRRFVRRPRSVRQHDVHGLQRGQSDESEASTKLGRNVASNRSARTATPVYTPLLGVTLMVFYVFALQCVSTVAIVRRETNSWKWPLFQWAYMGALAWGLAFVTFHVGHWLGWG